ncbi:MAG: tetratricopeptide repeat protein, partial [Persicimonas sp.]
PGPLWIVAALLLLWPAHLAAQDDDEKEETQISVDEADEQKEKPSLEEEDDDQEEGPGADLTAEEFIQDKDFESVRRADEQIVTLKELIDETDADEEKRAKYMFNLSERYWDKSKYYELEAFEKQDECYELEEKGDEKGVERCEQRMDQMLDESERLRQEAVDLYGEIIREYPNFENLDRVYFYLGTNLQEMDEEEKAQRIFKRLISDFPNTEYLPNVLINFGDYHFNNDEVEEALQAYQKATEFKDSEVYAYARYQEAWCYYNLDQRGKALDLFLQVVDYAEANPDKSNSEALAREAKKDIVRTYSHVGNPDKAVSFLKDLSKKGGEDTGDDWVELGERLAIHYGDNGQLPDSTAMYRHLISENQDSVKTIDYQYEVVRNQTSVETYSEKSIKELIRLLKLVRLADEGKFEDTEEENYDDIRKRVEGLVRQYATRYHREAQKTKNANLYSMAYFLYKHYLTTFPDSPERYKMTFFYGELLYVLERWEEAAQAYEKVLDIDPEGEFTEESVHAAVLAYFEVVDVSEERSDLENAETAQADEDGDSDEEDKEDEGPPEPKDLPEMHKKLINACKRYAEHAPDGDKIVDVKYTMARTYYDFNHLEEALEIFKDIAYEHPDHRLGVISANLHLDTLNLLEDFDGLHEAVVGYLEERPIDDEEFLEEAQTLNVQISFKKCSLLDDEEKWADAAQCYVDYYRDFPNEDEYIDKALYNAALDFERMRDLGKAIKVRVVLLEAAPGSDLAPDALFSIGGNYHALAVYSEAAKFYEMFVSNFPDHDDAEDALANASEFRYGLGQYDKAIEDYEKYLDLFGDQEPEQAAVAYFQIARIHEKRGEGHRAVDRYQDFLRRFQGESDHDRILKAHAAIGKYYWDQGTEGDKDRAMTEFDKVLDKFNALDEETQEELTDGRDAAARAKFMKGERVYEEMEEITVASSDEDELKDRLKEKVEVARDAEKIFNEVIQYRRPDWAIAALYRIGSQYQDLAENVRDSPVPDRLTADQEEIYKGILEDEASKIETRAVAAYEQALEVSRKENWFNEYSDQAEVELARLRPKEYRKPAEMSAEPDHYHPGFQRAEIISDVEEEERLQDFDDDADDAAEEATGDEVEEDTEQDESKEEVEEDVDSPDVM